MYPELFTVHLWEHEWTAVSYSFFYTLAIAFVLIGSYTSAVKKGFSRKNTLILIGTMTVAGFIGARGLHVLFNPNTYINGELSIIDFHMAGFTIVGGILCAIFFGSIVGRIFFIDIWSFADNTIPFVGAGIAIARIGCFLNGCCFGHVTQVPWGIHFPLLSPAHVYQITHGFGNIFFTSAVHPTQLYEMIAVIIGSIIALLISRNNLFSGAAVLFFGMWFSGFRFINSFFREFPDSLILSIWEYGLIYCGIFLFCLTLFIIRLKKSKNTI